jgi:hypothetical protein
MAFTLQGGWNVSWSWRTFRATKHKQNDRNCWQNPVTHPRRPSSYLYFPFFPKLKIKLKEWRFETVSDIKRELQAALDSNKENKWLPWCFWSWERTMGSPKLSKLGEHFFFDLSRGISGLQWLMPVPPGNLQQQPTVEIAASAKQGASSIRLQLHNTIVQKTSKNRS